MSAPPSTGPGTHVHAGTQRSAPPLRRRADSAPKGTVMGGTTPARNASQGQELALELQHPERDAE